MISNALFKTSTSSWLSRRWYGSMRIGALCLISILFSYTTCQCQCILCILTPINLLGDSSCNNHFFPIFIRIFDFWVDVYLLLFFLSNSKKRIWKEWIQMNVKWKIMMSIDLFKVEDRRISLKHSRLAEHSVDLCASFSLYWLYSVVF